MEVSTTNPVLDRLLAAAGFRKDSELARLLGVTPQAISKARKSGKTPVGWIKLVSEKFQISKQDLAPDLNRQMVEKNNTYKEPVVDSSELKLLYERCAKLEAELEKEKEERRELSAENRQLLRENGELKVEVAVQRERLKSLSGRSVDADVA